MPQIQPTIVTNWDSMPPEVYAEGEIYSTRVLAANYRRMEDALTALLTTDQDEHIMKIINHALGKK